MAKKAETKAETTKVEMVVLEYIYNDETKQREFTPEHAARLLGRPRNGGWKLPQNSNYKFDLKNGLTKGGNTEAVKATD